MRERFHKCVDSMVNKSRQPPGEILTMNMHRYLFSAVFFMAAFTVVHGKTVVFVPPGYTSYFVYHTNVAGELARLGHDVWICVPHFMLQRNLVKDKAVKVLPYGEKLGDIEAATDEHTRLLDRFWAREPMPDLSMLAYLGLMFNQIARDVLSDRSFVDKVKSLNPDLIVVDSIPFNINMVVLPYMLDIPFALIGTFQDVVLSKVPFSPAAPLLPIDQMSDRMPFYLRLLSVVYYIRRINFDWFYDSSILSEFAPDKPFKYINDVAANAEIFIIESDHIMDYPRPTLPNTKLLGGSSASPAKPLVGEFKKFVDEAKTGIIVVTFGGGIVNIPPYITNKLAAAFRQLDPRVVWKVNISSPNPDQILTSKWIPQNDLLGHEKTKLFVSHCGKNGQYEALYHGIPILCLPIYGDQNYNAERVVVKELGLRADMREATANELAALMKQLLYDSKYKENMKKASHLYRELYKVPKKEAAYWLDHVMQYGGKYMRSAGQEMPWYQLLLLDVLAFFVAVIMTITVVVYLIIKQCVKFCRSKPIQNKTKTN